jgi:hypothetical protein
MTNNQQLSEKIWGARDSLIDQRADAKDETVIADLQKAIMSLSDAALQLECGRVESSLRILDSVVPGDLGHLDDWQRDTIQMTDELKVDLEIAEAESHYHHSLVTGWVFDGEAIN